MSHAKMPLRRGWHISAALNHRHLPLDHVPMSISSSPPGSSTSFDLVSDDTMSVRRLSPLPHPQAPRYLYYRLYQNGGPLASYRMFGSDDDERGDRIGRLHIDDLSPPRNIRCLKRYIALLEGFSPAHVEEIFLTSDSSESEEDTVRLDLSPGAPGCIPDAPIHGIILDGAHRSPPARPLPRSLDSIASCRLSCTPTSPLIYKNILWNIDATGFAEPFTYREEYTSWSIRGSCDPPGWREARIKSASLDPPPVKISGDSFANFGGPLLKEDRILVDDRIAIHHEFDTGLSSNKPEP
ncbi:hypothetical protein DL93DRAFT_1705505 [Clavulina sp. PMI_390]|nr:hypothetical protein DL93DRAFT_1705505 [Clavulina sp. PMI_390]